jgi:hypothetical protein
MMLLTADDASRATSDLHNERPGVRTEYDAARTHPDRQRHDQHEHDRGGGDRLDRLAHTLELVTLGMIAANSSTTRRRKVQRSVP